MVYDEKLAERVRAILAELRGVTEKRLMGTLAFMVNGAMCCSVAGDGLLVRIAAEERDRVLGESFVSPMKLGARTMKGFVRVSLEGLRTRATLARWIERGIAAAMHRKESTSRRSASSSTGRRRKA
jgi:TfoX/Sxy family transcriptional regulator of competence genes